MTQAQPTAKIRPVILSGGAGTRLWPLSTAARPKQFLDLVGDGSLLRQTFERIADTVLFSDPTVICGPGHVEAVEQIAAAAGTAARLVVEPAARNTAAAIALAALTAEVPDELLLILPSDHHITAPDRFRATVDAARAGAEAGLIVTFGMKPTRIETGFGYVEAGEPLTGAVRRAVRFIEKPDAARAADMIASGDYLWNGGIFFASAATLIAAFEAHAPAVIAAVRTSLAVGHPPDPAAFATVPALAFDQAVMEKSDRVGIIPSDFGWSDVGSWIAAFEQAPRDEADNAVDPGSVVIDGSGNLVRSTGPRIVALGVEGLMLLATDEVILVAPLADAQRVREAHAWFTTPK